MIFKIFSPNNSAKKLAFVTENKANFFKKIDRDIGFREKRQFFRPKLSKIDENCDHNIGPGLNMGIISNQKSLFGYILEDLGVDNLAYFVSIRLFYNIWYVS
jgi:hypothetical protein